jgi:hypothetical protein
MPTSSQPQLTDPQALSLDLYAQLLQARDRLDDLLPIAERACTNAEALTISTLQGTDADPRPLMLDLTHLQSHLDGLTLNVSRAATLQTALCVEQATIPAHTPPRPLQQGAEALIPLTEAITTLRHAVGTGPRRLDQQARAAQALLIHLTRTLRQRPLTDTDLAPLHELHTSLRGKPDALQTAHDHLGEALNALAATRNATSNPDEVR